MSSKDRSLRGTITAADLAASEEDYEVAEDALLEALGEVRKRKQSTEAGHADD